MIETGKILQQRYRIDKQIGQGGMGAVYVATDERFNSTVAIKETLFMDDNYRKAIEREARLLNSLKHTALPRVSDHFLEENGQFLVMEYIPGEDLAFMLERDGKPFSVEQVLVWADQLLDALDFLHNQQNPVIHRDIKPQNLKITAKGQIILLDFGLAKGNPTDAGHLTAAKSIFGYSRNYASLEQIQGTGTDPRSDLYSLAATLYHLLTSQPPEDALTRAMSVLSHQPDPLLPAHHVRAEIPVGLAGILHNSMDLNASARPQSAAEMRNMLKNLRSYEHLATSAGYGAAVPEHDLSSQRTKLFPGTTRQGNDGQTHVKTEILPVYISEETAVRRTAPDAVNFAGAASGKGGGTRRRMAFASLAGLLLVGGLAAGAYVYDPGIYSDDQPRVVEGVKAAPAADTDTMPVQEAAVNPPAAETSPEPEALAGAPSSVGSRPETDRTQTKPPTRALRASGSGRRTASADANNVNVDPDFDLKGKTIYIGNIKIKDGRVETPDAFMDENGITPKTPNMRASPPVAPGMRYLTPAQRQKLLLLQQEQKRQQLEQKQRKTPPANRP